MIFVSLSCTKQDNNTHIKSEHERADNVSSGDVIKPVPQNTCDKLL